MTKALSLLLIMIISGNSMFAQINKGAILLNGQVSYSNAKLDYSTNPKIQKNRSGTFNISVGKALKENSVFGVSLSYGGFNNDNGYNETYYSNMKVNNYSAGVFYRQYKKLAKDFYLFAQMGLGYVGSTQTDADSSGNKISKYSSSGALLVLTPGVAYKLFKKLYIEVTIPGLVYLQYNSSKTNFAPNNYTQKQFVFNTNLNGNTFNNLGVGFSLVL